jgi:hypothetical protein
MADELLYEQVGAFSGTYPPIENRANFQPDENDSEPFFVTLPIGQTGNESENGRLYDADFYSELVRQVNHAPADNPITGIVGHSDPNAQAWKVDLPNFEWVGAKIAENGTVWGKMYIYPEETKLRTSTRRHMKRNSVVATSIWGEAKMEGKRAVNPTIKRIDYADPERAGVKAAIGIPQITSEMIEKDNEMSDVLIAELRTERDKARGELATLQEQITLLSPAHDAMKAKLATLQELAGSQDLIVYVSELRNQVDTSNREKLALEIGKMISEQVKLEVARPIIETMLGQQPSKEAAQTRLSELLNETSVKQMLQSYALAIAGGHAYIGEHKDTETLD